VRTNRRLFIGTYTPPAPYRIPRRWVQHRPFFGRLDELQLDQKDICQRRPEDVDPEVFYTFDSLMLCDYFALGQKDRAMVDELLYDGAGIVAAMWGLNGILPRDILESRLVRFPMQSVLRVVGLLWSRPPQSRERIVNVVYFVYQLDKVNCGP